jgi:cytochrome c oxidase subunit IV
MLAALPCRTGVCLVHAYVGYAIVGGWGLLFLWGLVTFLVRREPDEWYWRLLAGLQVILIVQLAAGLVLLVTGHDLPGVLHLAYGVVFPTIVLVVAHVVGRGMEDEADAWKVFAVASFFVFGLTLRALTTGMGLP